MPPKGKGPGQARTSSFRSFFAFILAFALLSSAFLYFNSVTLINPFLEGILTPSTIRSVHIVVWDVKEGESEDGYRTFMRDALDRHTLVSRTCPFNCTFTKDRTNLHLADAVVFDPTVLDYDNWRRIPLTLPHKQPWQQWVMLSYQHQHNYPLTVQPTYAGLMDLQMTYRQNSDVPLSLFCPWGDSFGQVTDILQPFTNKREKNILWMSSNCQFSGASARTTYVTELMKYIPIDSYGKCLHNTDWGGQKAYPTFAHMDEKIALMREYKIVLAFENGNVTDYVTEKVFNAFQAGALPIYMGAPNIDEWLPGPRSVVKTSDFNSPKALAEYLQKLLDDKNEYDLYFQWKKTATLSPQFVEKFDRCMYTSECRLCQKVAESITPEIIEVKDKLAPGRHPSTWQAIKLNGQGDHIKVRHHKRLCVTDRYTLMAWIKPATFSDQRVIDKNKAGTVTGFNFDIQSGEHSKGFLRLCAGEGCVMSKKAIYKDTWTHIAVVYSSEHPSLFQNHIDFYINGVLDHSEIIFAPTKQETWYPLTFGKPANTKDAASCFHGSMDNVAVFDRDLTGEEVRKYMFTVPVGNEAGLVGWWPFDDGPNDKSTHDIGSYEYDGELVGGTREPSIEKPLHLGRCQ